jgi:hypothetical protein
VAKHRNVLLSILAFLGAMGGIASCHESDVELNPGAGVGTDSATLITGRDSAHRVPEDTTTTDSETMTSTGSDTVADTVTGEDTMTADGSDSETQTGSDTATGVADTGTSTVTDSATNSAMTPESWTLMMYMSADSNLEADMMVDLQELAAVNVPEWLNILILFDRHDFYDTSDGNWTGTRLFRVNPTMDGGLERLSDDTFLMLTDTGDNEELDLGDGATLSTFISFAHALYPANHYGLVLSGHGNGWMKKGQVANLLGPRVICTDDSGRDEGILVQRDLKAIVHSFNIEVVGFDACLMGMVETAWALKDGVKYMIASEANEASYGWDYEAWITGWINSAEYTARSLARQQVVTYSQYHDTREPPWLMTMAVVDMEKLDALGIAINNFVMSHNAADYVNGAMNFDDVYPEYYDLWHMADLAGDSALKAAIEDAVIEFWHSGNQAYPGGLSIMYVEETPADYRQSSFCKDLDWC